jgi:mono/diheme cytochrome c family protein
MKNKSLVRLFAIATLIPVGSLQLLLAATPASTPASIEKGKASYKINCVACHGEKADGKGPAAVALNPKPRSFSDGTFKQGDSPEKIFKTLETGVPGGAMVSFKHLPEAERWALVHYILSLRKK